MRTFSHSVGLDVLGAHVLGDGWKDFGRGWGAVHETVAPYLEPIKSIPVVGPFIDAGDTVYTTYRGATGEQTGKQKEQAAAKEKEQAAFAEWQKTHETPKPSSPTTANPSPDKPSTTPSVQIQPQPQSGKPQPNKWPVVAVVAGGAVAIAIAVQLVFGGIR